MEEKADFRSNESDFEIERNEQELKMRISVQKRKVILFLFLLVLIFVSLSQIKWIEGRIDVRSDEMQLYQPEELYADQNENSLVEKSKEDIVVDNPEPLIIDTDNSNDVIELTTEDMERIERRFKERRERMLSVCRGQDHQPPQNIDELVPKSHPFLLNQIFHDSDMSLSGCLPPKTGTTSWNHFWWGVSKYDGARPGQFDSFQSQGNRYIRKWEKTLKQEKPKILFLTVRHPIDRLLSGWNNILCNKNCRNADRVRYSLQALSRMRTIYEHAGSNMNGKWNGSSSDPEHMIPFPNFASMLIKDFATLDGSNLFDIHFHSYDRSCFICDIPYQYIVKLETFAEDYQFIMKKLGLWDTFDEEHKAVGIHKENESVGLKYESVLSQLSNDQLHDLIRLKQGEMEMFGYEFNFNDLQSYSLLNS